MVGINRLWMKQKQKKPTKTQPNNQMQNPPKQNNKTSKSFWKALPLEASLNILSSRSNTKACVNKKRWLKGRYPTFPQHHEEEKKKFT